MVKLASQFKSITILATMDVGGVAIASIQALDQRDAELSLKAEQLALENARLQNDVASLKSELADVKALLLQLAPQVTQN